MNSSSRDLFADIKQRDPNFARLYGFAFHPRFAENRYCYISYVLKDRTPDGSRVSRFKVTATDPPRLVPESEEIVLRWYARRPQRGASCSSAPTAISISRPATAAIAFPPDGRNTGQNISDLEASILRIDVDHRDAGLPYRIPAGQSVRRAAECPRRDLGLWPPQSVEDVFRSGRRLAVGWRCRLGNVGDDRSHRARGQLRLERRRRAAAGASRARPTAPRRSSRRRSLIATSKRARSPAGISRRPRGCRSCTGRISMATM